MGTNYMAIILLFTVLWICTVVHLLHACDCAAVCVGLGKQIYYKLAKACNMPGTCKWKTSRIILHKAKTCSYTTAGSLGVGN